VRPPGIRFEDLPPIDAVVVSHNHYDHMDLPTLRRLARERPCPILVPLGNRAFLEGEEDLPRVEDLEWWQERSLTPRVRVVCVPARHFSQRGIGDRDAALWGGFVVEGPSGRALFAGCTGDGPHVEEIARRFAPLRLAMVPIGAYRPRWFMSPVHLDPREAVGVVRRRRRREGAPRRPGGRARRAGRARRRALGAAERGVPGGPARGAGARLGARARPLTARI
jgi:L-ascorbate metabolism protein UlaG (beta-lactamase superfamily)